MANKRELVYHEHYCERKSCGRRFLVDQLSRQRYCPECISKLVMAGKKLEE